MPWFSTQNAANEAGIATAARTAAPGYTIQVTSERKCSCNGVDVICGTSSASCTSEPEMYVSVSATSTFGFVVWSNGTLKYSVDTTVRYASLNGARSPVPASAASLEQMLRANAIGLEQQLLTVEVEWLPNNRPGSTVRIAGTYAVPTLVNIVWANAFPLRATSQMLIVN